MCIPVVRFAGGGVAWSWEETMHVVAGLPVANTGHLPAAVPGVVRLIQVSVFLLVACCAQDVPGTGAGQAAGGQAGAAHVQVSRCDATRPTAQATKKHGTTAALAGVAHESPRTYVLSNGPWADMRGRGLPYR